ncbi:hypothetical protein THAOC_00050, partial [Thalassiosira oceanica]
MEVVKGLLGTRECRFDLKLKIAGGAPCKCKEIDQEYYPPRESSIALNRDGPNFGGSVEAAQRVRKKADAIDFSEITKKRDFR